MKKILLFLSLVPSLAISQVIELRNYDLEKKPALHKLTKAESEEPVVFIKDKRVTEYIYNKNDELEEYFTLHRIVHLNESKSVEDFNKIYVSVNDPSDLVGFKARSISKNGAIKEMLKGEMKSVTDEGRNYMTIAIDGLETGSELEYYYTTKENIRVYGSQSIQGKTYQRNVEMQMIVPDNIFLEIKAYNGFPQLKDTLIGKKRFYSADMDNIVPIQEEKYAAEDANKMRVEYKIAKNIKRDYSKLMTFADAGNRYFNSYNNFEKGELKDIDKAMSRLNMKNLSDYEKVRAIESFIKTNINMQKGADVRNVSEALKTKISDEYNINKMFAGFLKQTGIKYEMVLTVSRYDKKFDPAFETWNYLDEILFYLPSLDIYSQPTNYVYRLPLYPYQFFGNSGLFIKEVTIGDISSAVTSVKKLPEPPTSLSHHNMDITIKFSDGFKEANQHTKQTMAGYASTGYRPFYFYASDDKKKELMEEIMKTDIDAAKVTNLKVTNFNLNSSEADKDFTIEADLTYSSLIEKADKTYLFKVGAVIGTQVEMYQEKPRQNPIEIEFPHNLDRNIVITIPDGYIVKGLDALKMNVTGGDNTMGFVSDYTLNGNKLEIKIHEFYNKISYTSTMYDEFRKVINASADFNKVTIIFERKS